MRQSLRLAGSRLGARPISTVLTRRPTRRGVTLLELLTGVVIALTLTAAAIPLLRPALVGRKQRESARLIATYIEGIRSRALEAGGSYGLWINRDPNAPHLATSLQVCQNRAPYTGTSSDSRAMLRGFIAPLTAPPYTTIVQAANPVASWGLIVTPGVASTTAIVDPANFNWGSDFIPDAGVNAPKAGRRVSQVGDLVQLGGSDTVYLIFEQYDIENTYDNGAVDWLLVPIDAATLPPSVPTLPPPSSPPPMLSAVPRLETFRVIRAPERTVDRPLLLPGGMVIDLMASGMGINLPLNQPLKLPPNGPRTGQETFFPLQDASYSASDNGQRYSPTSSNFRLPVTTERKPVVIMFGKSGTIERVYQHRYYLDDTGQPIPIWTWYSNRPLDGVYLLLAKREQLPTAAALAQSSWPGTLPKNSDTGEAGTSWRDQTNLWLSLNPQSGRMLISPVAPAIPGLDQAFTWNGANPQTIEWLYSGIATSRRLAAQGIRAGEQ